MKMTQKNLMRVLREWRIADDKAFLAGTGYNEAMLVWDKAVKIAKCCSISQINDIVCATIRHPQLCGFYRQDIQHVQFQIKCSMETILTF